MKRVYTWDEPTSSWGSPTAVTKFVYDGWRVIMELDGLNSDAISRKHTWGLDLSGSTVSRGTFTSSQRMVYQHGLRGSRSEQLEM